MPLKFQHFFQLHYHFVYTLSELFNAHEATFSANPSSATIAYSVIRRIVRQHFRLDFLRLFVHRQVKFTPSPAFAPAVLANFPFAFAVNFQAGTVNDKTLGQMVKSVGLGDEPRRIFDELGKIQLVDVILPTRDGPSIRRRCIPVPTEHQEILLQRLGLNLPRQFKNDF